MSGTSPSVRPDSGATSSMPFHRRHPANVAVCCGCVLLDIRTVVCIDKDNDEFALTAACAVSSPEGLVALATAPLGSHCCQHRLLDALNGCGH